MTLAAAYEVDRMIQRPPAPALAVAARRAWARPQLGVPRVEEAKGLAVDRIAEMKRPEAYATLYDCCLEEPSYRVRVSAAQWLGAGGDRAIDALHERLVATVNDGAAAKANGFATLERPDERRYCLQGWLLPLLAATAGPSHRDDVTAILERWLRVCDGAPPAFDACLAQGFKYEANRIPRGRDQSFREPLVAGAQNLLDTTGYWYTRLTLMHAMTLWTLGYPPRSPDDQRRRVLGWAGEDRHPFVLAAADLCSRTLATRTPSPYIWIDEAGIVAKLGQRSAPPETTRASSLWLADSLGWVALGRRALRLVGDVLLMLNLTDGHYDPAKPARHLERAPRACGDRLPPCLVRAGERASSLAADSGDGEAPFVAPGVTCAGGCTFHLCPYPQAGSSFRPEFSESFCRHLATFRGHASWQHMDRSELREFWLAMARRVRAG